MEKLGESKPKEIHGQGKEVQVRVILEYASCVRKEIPLNYSYSQIAYSQ